MADLAGGLLGDCWETAGRPHRIRNMDDSAAQPLNKAKLQC